MNIYELNPEELAALSLVIAIKIARDVDNVQQKYVIANFFSTIASNIALMNAQVLNFQNITKFDPRTTAEETVINPKNGR